jgi:esterase/lipase superfamily enzyme
MFRGIPLISLAVLIVLSGAQSQDALSLRVIVPPGERVRSESIALNMGDELQVRLEALPGQGQPIVSVYVHAKGGELVGRDDPDTNPDVYTFHVGRSGIYYLLLQNSGTGAGVVRATRGRAGVVARGDVSNYATVRVFFATDREVVGNAPAHFFGSEPAGRLTVGYSDVSVPRDHRLGELEGPSIFRLEFRNDPERHVVLLRLQLQSMTEFSRAVAGRIVASVRREALMFVHGFNVSFENSARRAAQISYDLAFDGPTVLFSWPSQAGVLPTDYRKDERNADLSADSLKRVMLSLLGSTRDITLHVIAHSMGNRVLASALQQIAAESAQPRKLRQVAMIAPDIDAELFRRAAGKIAMTAERVTLYASSEDAALKLSRTIAGYPRAGQGGADVIVVPGIDTIDASSVDTSILGLSHSYYADNTTILSDLFALFRGRPPAERFGLRSVTGPRGVYWRFLPAVR